MKLRYLFVAIVFLSIQGCRQFYQGEEYYVSVTMINQSDTTITGVSIGSGRSSSRFGILGRKGAGKGAVVPIRFIPNFAVRWEEGQTDHKHLATVDISGLAGCNHIILTYQGNGVWAARKDEPLLPGTRGATSPH